MTNEPKSSQSSENKVPRRQFLANLLFAGGALSVAAFQAKSVSAEENPKDDGWDLPEDKPDTKKDDWDLPDDLLDSPDPKPQPLPSPPQPPGGMRPPHIRGKVKPPEPSPTAGVPIPNPDN